MLKAATDIQRDKQKERERRHRRKVRIMAMEITSNTCLPLKLKRKKTRPRGSIFDQLGIIMDAADRHLTCAICNDLFVEPSTIPCGHTFCSNCIHDWFQTKENCPVCRQSAPGGLRSENIDLLSEFIKCAKPILAHRRIHNVENVNGYPSTDPNGGKFTKKKNQALLKCLKKSLGKINSEKSWNSMDVAVRFVRTAVVSGRNMKDVYRDVQGYRTDALLRKYMKLPINIPNNQEYRYHTVKRHTEIRIQWPTPRSWFQLAFFFFTLAFIQFFLGIAEERGFGHIQDAFIRTLAFLHLYIEVFRGLAI